MYCDACGCYIGEHTGKRGRPRKYCMSCAYWQHLETMKRWVKKRRKYTEELGTTNISPKMNTDFKKEARIVKSEFRKLKLRRKK